MGEEDGQGKGGEFTTKGKPLMGLQWEGAKKGGGAKMLKGQGGLQRGKDWVSFGRRGARVMEGFGFKQRVRSKKNTRPTISGGAAVSRGRNKGEPTRGDRRFVKGEKRKILREKKAMRAPRDDKEAQWAPGG